MTRDRLHCLLFDTNHLGAEACLTELGDALVTRDFVSSNAFWSASLPEQMLYALCSVLHHAGHNGFGVVWDYHHGDGTGMIAATMEALELIGAHSLRTSAQCYWNIMTEQARTQGLHVPESFSKGNRKDFCRLHEFILRQRPSVFESHYSELEKHADVFVSCWNGDFPTLALKWLQSQEGTLAAALCEK